MFAVFRVTLSRLPNGLRFSRVALAKSFPVKETAPGEAWHLKSPNARQNVHMGHVGLQALVGRQESPGAVLLLHDGALG